MTLGDMLSQVGIGKQISERYTEYGTPAQDQNLFYAYDPSIQTHGHVVASKHNYGSGGQKSNAAMSALTLLAFLFFLHILQQCLKDHITSMSAPQVMIMATRREGEEVIPKMSDTNKIDKIGNTRTDKHNTKSITKYDVFNESNNIKTPVSNTEETNIKLTKIRTENSPKIGEQKFKNVFKNYPN